MNICFFFFVFFLCSFCLFLSVLFFSLLFVEFYWFLRLDSTNLKIKATINGHSYSTFIGPVPSNGSPGLPLHDNSTPTPNPPVTTSSNTGDEDGSTTTKYDQGPSKYDQSQQGSQSQNQHDHHHAHDIDNRSFPTESPNDQSSLIILQPSGTSSEIGSSNSATGLGAYSPMLPSFSHYAPGKYSHSTHLSWLPWNPLASSIYHLSFWSLLLHLVELLLIFSPFYFLIFFLSLNQAHLITCTYEILSRQSLRHIFLTHNQNLHTLTKTIYNINTQTHNANYFNW